MHDKIIIEIDIEWFQYWYFFVEWVVDGNFLNDFYGTQPEITSNHILWHIWLNFMTQYFFRLLIIFPNFYRISNFFRPSTTEEI
jgi:hypothetical protein